MQPLMGMRRTNQGRQVGKTQYAEEAPGPESDLHQSTAQSRFDSVRRQDIRTVWKADFSYQQEIHNH